MTSLVEEPAAPHHPINLGIAGLGLAGALMVRAAQLDGGVSLVAAADPRAAPLKAFMHDFDANGYTNVQDLCKDEAVDVVYIGTPHQFHAEHAIAAAAAGKHIILEKPMALTLAECDAILEAVQRYGVCLVVGHTHAYDPGIRAMRRVIAAGHIGRVRMITTLNYTDFMYRPRRPEELDTDAGGGIVFNQIPHQIEIIRTLGGGKLRSVRASCGVLDPTRPTETIASAFWDFKDGTTATSVYSGADFFNSDEFHDWVDESGAPRDPQHASSRRKLKHYAGLSESEQRAQQFSYGALKLPLHAPMYQPHFGITILTCERGEMRSSPSGFTLYDEHGAHNFALSPSTGYEGIFNDLRLALSTGNSPRHDVHWGKASAEAMLALLQSARERKEVALTHQTAMPHDY
ncbi:Gfo/Idh/MocA family protein [Eoetvoesiella caeni]|nr:Gfo/Idh/MocA family oxidoreductase [Eoetvoesiella caeni]MCI2810973.1 Gfo/Idh/MocA family oxidoreductase [Eoetvoesiella caeni]NYT56872.1 Gfo/Idh/MocA family oxidoreductase [Eoetvoesiella caeni]